MIDAAKEPVPEADALEQQDPVVEEEDGDDAVPRVALPDDAAEGDAIEQATPVPGQDEGDAPR